MTAHIPLDWLAIGIYAAVFAGVVALTLQRARYGLAMLIALPPFAFYHDVGETTVTLSKVALVGFALALAARGPRLWLLRERPARGLISAGILVLLATALSVLHAHFVHPAVRETLKQCEYLLLFVCVYVAYRRDPDSNLVRNTFCGVVIAVSILALAQEFIGAPSALLINHHIIPRIAGPLEGPNQLAAYLGIALPLLFAFSKSPSRPLLCALALGSCAEVLTFSRAGVVSAALGMLVVFLSTPRGQLRHALRFVWLGTAFGVLVVAFWGAVAQSLGILRLWKFDEINYAGGVGTRNQLWLAAIRLWRAHPFYGIGAGNFEFEIGDVGPRNIRTHANSLYLQSLVELGIPGFCATVFLVWRSIASFAKERFASPLILGAFAGSIALAVHQFTDLLVFYPKVGSTWWIVIALACAEVAAREPKEAIS